MADASVLIVEGSEHDDIFLCNCIADDARTWRRHQRGPTENRTRIVSMPSMQIHEQCGECVHRMLGVTTRCTSPIDMTNEMFNMPHRSLRRKRNRPHRAAGNFKQ